MLSLSHSCQFLPGIQIPFNPQKWEQGQEFPRSPTSMWIPSSQTLIHINDLLGKILARLCLLAWTLSRRQGKTSNEPEEAQECTGEGVGCVDCTSSPQPHHLSDSSPSSRAMCVQWSTWRSNPIGAASPFPLLEACKEIFLAPSLQPAYQHKTEIICCNVYCLLLISAFYILWMTTCTLGLVQI